MITLKDIAALAGVSEATVSRALRDDKNISEDTRQRIQKLARQMGHTSNRLARSLALKRTNTVGLVVPVKDNAWFRQLSWAIARHFADRGYICIAPFQEPHDAVKYLAGATVDGIVLWGDGLIQERTPQELAFLGSVFRRMPAVCISANLRHLGVPSIDVDRRQAMREVVQLLVNHGHRRIAFAGRIESMRGTTQEKVAGYVRAMESYGLPALLANCPLDQRAALEETERILSQVRPTALIAEDNRVALGFRTGCWRLGVAIPNALSLVGYDNIKVEGNHNGITAIGPDSDEMALAAVEALMERMNRPNNEGDQTDTRSVVATFTSVALRWHEGGSVGPPS